MIKKSEDRLKSVSMHTYEENAVQNAYLFIPMKLASKIADGIGILNSLHSQHLDV